MTSHIMRLCKICGNDIKYNKPKKVVLCDKCLNVWYFNINNEIVEMPAIQTFDKCKDKKDLFIFLDYIINENGLYNSVQDVVYYSDCTGSINQVIRATMRCLGVDFKRDKFVELLVEFYLKNKTIPNTQQCYSLIKQHLQKLIRRKKNVR